MFAKIQHVGYQVADLDRAIAWFEEGFGGQNAGGGSLDPSYAVPSGGRNAFVRFGQVEVELIEPVERRHLAEDALAMHHVGYVVSDIAESMVQLKAIGFKFAAAAPFTNPLGQRVLYFDAVSTNGVLMHLTELPDPPRNVGFGAGLKVDGILHAGYLVENLEDAIAWYVDKFGGVHIGGGRGPFRGNRIAFVDFGQVQVELIEPADKSGISGKGHLMDHVGYTVGDIDAAIAECRARGFRFVADEPRTNPVGYRVLYFDAATCMGARIHLTQLPD